jgi:tetrapyrrole methylase family protein / MazG family protein
MNTSVKKEKYSIDDLVEVMHRLRAPDGCPWDSVQTHESIRRDFLEECYEAVEAIDANSSEMMREELGDVLLQVVFHSVMEEEKGNFDFSDVVNDVAAKMIIRHPHVFGDTEVKNVDEVWTNWDEIKKQTKGQESDKEMLMSVSKAMPALMRGQKVVKKAKKLGVDYSENPREELKKLVNKENLDEKDIGKMLLLISDISFKSSFDAEKSLYDETNRFIEQNF